MENQAISVLETHKTQIENLLAFKEDLNKILSDQGTETIKKCSFIVIQQLRTIIESKPVAPTQDESRVVSQAVRILADAVVEKPITPLFRDLCTALMPVVHNWNAATVKNGDITAQIRLIDNMAKAQLSLIDAISVLQKLIDKARAIVQYEPPAFNLSRAYLENLKKAVEEKGSDALVEKSEETK